MPKSIDQLLVFITIIIGHIQPSLAREISELKIAVSKKPFARLYRLRKNTLTESLYQCLDVRIKNRQ